MGQFSIGRGVHMPGHADVVAAAWMQFRCSTVRSCADAAWPRGGRMFEPSGPCRGLDQWYCSHGWLGCPTHHLEPGEKDPNTSARMHLDRDRDFRSLKGCTRLYRCGSDISGKFGRVRSLAVDFKVQQASHFEVEVR